MSSSYAPVELVNSEVPYFSRNEIFPFLPSVAVKGGTRPGMKYLARSKRVTQKGHSRVAHLVTSDVLRLVPDVQVSIPFVQR